MLEYQFLNNKAYLRPQGSHLHLGHSQVKSLHTDFLLKLVCLVEEIGIQAPVGL